MYTLEYLQQKSLKELKEIGWELNVLPDRDRRCRQNWIDVIFGSTAPLLKLLEVSPAASVEQVQEPIIETVETSPGVEVEPVQEAPLESKFGRIVYPRPVQEAIKPAVETFPGVEIEPAQEAIEIEYGRITGYLCRPKSPLEQAAKTSPGVEVDPVEDQQLPECVECFDDGFVEDESGVIKLCQCGIEPKLSRESVQSAIAPAAKHHLDQESDPNPILTGIPLSDRFLARYSPPQPENILFKSEPDGQLTLLDFEVQSQPEPPDPDDFESLDAFREAIALWDAQNPESLAVSLDSMCEWAPCPEAWYEPEPESLPFKASSMIELPEQSEVMELLPGCKSSITSEFFIPTFGRWGDRQNGSDEPPDTGIFARLPKPKPPKFPPQASQPKSAHVRRAPQDYPETIPKQFSRVAAGSSTQPARSPPGGDAM